MQRVSSASPIKERAEDMMPSVGIIILNWNGLDDTLKCLASIRAQSYKNIQTVVVDNASEDDEATVIATRFPEVTVIREGENLGFGRAVNVGVRHLEAVGTPYVLLMNNDAWFDPNEGTIEKLVSVMESEQSLGGVGPLILNATEPHTIQSAGHLFSLFTAYPHRLMSGRPRNSAIRITNPTYIVGACLLLRTSLLRSLRGFDPDYFVYGEDIDLALRSAALGQPQALVPSTYVYHKKSVATTMWSENHTYLMLRSQLILLRKHARWYHLPTVVPSIIAISVVLALLGLKNGHPLAIKGAIRAWYDFMLHKWGGIKGKPLVLSEDAWLADIA